MQAGLEVVAGRQEGDALRLDELVGAVDRRANPSPGRDIDYPRTKRSR